MNCEPLQIGIPTHPNATAVRIVHISDTHMKLPPSVPDGDILVHSGDFFDYLYSCQSQLRLHTAVREIDRFFKTLPHKHKIYVAGNHDVSLDCGQSPETIAALMTDGIYLCDRQISLCGINIYGTPWSNSEGMAFYKENRRPMWEKIPRNTDILITHIPPFGIKDFGYNKFWKGNTWKCFFCMANKEEHQDVIHGRYTHQGCQDLREAIFSRIRPKVHLFGHVHNHNGSVWQDDILFCNGALDCIQRPIVIDYFQP